ncbi:ABC transporter ATP-binding protein [Thermostaphylospora chromogena]|uniref:ABC transporter ATP-binding protein n=1 Tax=Thermostaphylospora chromogena TaxID=35622 RepID=UPI001F60B5B0|nr:ABC transporter ATP-binding protein [Thermostaphylospora chromogena]
MSASGAVRALGLAWRAGWALVIGAGALAVAEALMPVCVAWLTKIALDVVTGRSSGGLLVAVGTGLAVAGLAVAVLPQLSQYARRELERRVGVLAQDRLFRAAERLVGLSRFENPAFLDRMSLAHQSGGSTPGLVTAGIMSVGKGVVVVLGFLGSLVAVSPVLAAAVLAAAIPAFLAELRLARGRAAMMWRVGPVERREMFYRRLLTTVQAAKELRLFGTGPYLRGLMTAERRAANAERRHMDRRELATQSVLGLLSAGMAAAALAWALALAWQGRLTAGDVALLVTSVAGVQGAVATLVNEVTMAHEQLLLFNHYLAVVDGEPDLPVPARPRPVPVLRRGIEFRGVWFRYSPAHPWVLRDLNLTIPHGAAIGVVGRNGAGKSTLVKLLCRLYDPVRGAVLWDGVDLRDMDPAELRSRIGAVFQDYMTYDLSAALNIALGDVSALDERGRDDRDRVRSAALRAGAHDMVAALPQGYDTLLSRSFADGTTGVTLSGGQWQRLALARAMLRDRRDLLILDEPSSGLDAEAEYEIHTRLREHRAGYTSLLVSHRLGAVRDADLLVVLEDGTVAEQGTHAELLRRGGVYARLFDLQARGYAEDAPAATLGRNGG